MTSSKWSSNEIPFDNDTIYANSIILLYLDKNLWRRLEFGLCASGVVIRAVDLYFEIPATK